MNVREPVLDRDVRIPLAHAGLAGSLSVPLGARGIVLFAHGSGSSRSSPRNAMVARQLQRAGIATLLFDLLTEAEEQRDMYSREHRFDIDLLSQRLVGVTHWVHSRDELRELRIGYFGASTGSAAALVAAGTLGSSVVAVVSRGGRPDLAGDDVLTRVRAATLLIVGGEDDVVIELNERAFTQLHCEKELAIIPNASHLFVEPGTLEHVAQLASAWFRAHLLEHIAHS